MSSSCTEVVILFLKELDLLVGLAPATETQAAAATPLQTSLEMRLNLVPPKYAMEVRS